MSGRNWARKAIKPLSCAPRKLVWPSTPPMPLSTPSSANRSLNPLGIQGSTLPVVVRAQDDHEVALLTLGQVAVGERQPGQVARAQARADLRALDERRGPRRRSADSKSQARGQSQARGRGQGGDRLAAMNLHVRVLLWFSGSDGIDARSPDEATRQASTPLRLAHDRRDLGELSSPESGNSPPGAGRPLVGPVRP